MAARYAILCPGQGGQHPGMFDLLRQHERSNAMLQALDLPQRLPCLPGAQASGIADDAALEHLLHDDDLLFANRYAQPLIVAVGLAAWHGLREDLPPPDLVAGYSVGELSAYSIAGFWSPATAIDLAVARAEYMDGCRQQTMPQGMLAVSGIAVASMTPILQRHNVHAAIETGFDSVIVGGRSENLQHVQQQLNKAGAHCVMLPVGIASHTPLMAGAQASFAETLERQAWHQATIPLLAGVSGQIVADQRAAQTALIQQLTVTIHWSACMDACAERGISVALELGPGAALSRMLRERQPEIECRSLADFRSVDGALRWLQRRIG